MSNFWNYLKKLSFKLHQVEENQSKYNEKCLIFCFKIYEFKLFIISYNLPVDKLKTTFIFL